MGFDYSGALGTYAHLGLQDHMRASSIGRFPPSPGQARNIAIYGDVFKYRGRRPSNPFLPFFKVHEGEETCMRLMCDYLSRIVTKPTKWHVRPAKTQMPSLIRVFDVRMKKA